VTEQALEFVTLWGLPSLALIVMLSCLAIPVPSSLVMLACGSMIAAGELPMVVTWAVAAGAAIMGDQIGYGVGRLWGSPLLARFKRANPKSRLVDRAKVQLHRSGWISVFLSRWLMSPLGPYVNILCGATHFRWPLFTVWSVCGEIVWVTLYLTLGYAFGHSIRFVAEISADVNGILVSFGVIFGVLWYAHHWAKRRGLLSDKS